MIFFKNLRLCVKQIDSNDGAIVSLSPSPSSHLKSQPLNLYLAPMEGVTDWIMRDLLTRLGGIDVCVTEFLRVTKSLHPNKVFLRHCPELLTQSKTAVGVPVMFQLLGGEPGPMSENAQRVAELGAAGVDLNFGCPAKTVNRHDGGAVLLKTPQRLYDILKSVRQSVPATIPVSGKIRLGYEDTNQFKENALALQEAGASWITVHCRTKTQGYRPSAHWNFLTELKEDVHIPIIANGDIDSLESFHACRNVTQLSSFMIGRAALSNPFLFKLIKLKEKSNISLRESFLTEQLTQHQGILSWSAEEEWCEIERLIYSFYLFCEHHINGYYATSRTKQWLKYLLLKKEHSSWLFNKIKAFRDPSEFREQLMRHLLILNRDPSERTKDLSHYVNN